MKGALAALGGAALVFPAAASAHGIGGVTDLPVPVWMFAYGASTILLLSFAALGVLWKAPQLQGRREIGELPQPLQRLLLGPVLRVLLGGASAGTLALVFAAALVGDRSANYNLAPTFVWVVFWLGLVPVVVVFGDVWRVLSPWAAVADAAAWLTRRRTRRPPARYPERLGRRPAAALLFLFTALELVYGNPSDPRMLAVAIAVYSAVTWAGMLRFGRARWLADGDAFSVYFGLLARLSIFAVRTEEDGRKHVVIRRPLSGLATRDARTGTLAFVAVMLGSVSFDGFSRTMRWQGWRYDAATSSAANRLPTLLNLAGLTTFVVGVALAYLAAVGAARRLSQAPDQLAGVFVWSLVPIALAYVIAHYFSLLVLQGQYALPLASDPFGRGWDLLGTAGYRPRLTILSPSTIWYTQVGALVVGHVLGLVVAHDRALVRFRSPRAALRSQYAMLALMVAYTGGGLFLLSLR